MQTKICPIFNNTNSSINSSINSNINKKTIKSNLKKVFVYIYRWFL